MARPTIAYVASVVSKLAAHESPFVCPKTRNKGAAGVLCEKLTGIPQTSAHLDCVDGEVKVFPLKRQRDGTLVPKETIAVTMVNEGHLAAQAEFADSTCGTKLRRVLFVPYFRETDEHIRFFAPTDFALTPEWVATLGLDYVAIRNAYVTDNAFASGIGAFLQTRTKGAGGDAPKTRAFYLKKEFIHACVTKSW